MGFFFFHFLILTFMFQNFYFGPSCLIAFSYWPFLFQIFIFIQAKLKHEWPKFWILRPSFTHKIIYIKVPYICIFFVYHFYIFTCTFTRLYWYLSQEWQDSSSLFIFIFLTSIIRVGRDLNLECLCWKY